MEKSALRVIDLFEPEDKASGGLQDVLQKAKRESASSGQYIAVRASKAIGSDELDAAMASDTDVTLVVSDVAAATDGRAASDLSSALWVSYPTIAALLSTRLSRAGCVVFSPATIQSLDFNDATSLDPVTLAVASVVQRNGSVRTVLLPNESQVALPDQPAELSPQEPTNPRSSWKALLEGVDIDRCVQAHRSTADAIAVRAGLLMWHDFLSASHQCSQSIEGEGRQRAGDFWHAIMHRREGDFGNSKYWYRRVGNHPLFEALANRLERAVNGSGDHVQELVDNLTRGGKWNPSAFVDACERNTESPDGPTGLLLRRLQADEMLLLLWHSCQDARGDGQ